MISHYQGLLHHLFLDKEMLCLYTIKAVFCLGILEFWHISSIFLKGLSHTSVHKLHITAIIKDDTGYALLFC